MSKHVVAPLADLPPGSRKLVTVKGRPVVVFNVDGELFALVDRCPHKGGSLCEGDYQSDLSPTLACLGARVQVHGPEGVRTVSVLDFLRDTYEVDLARGEFVTGIEVPLPRPNMAAAYLKHVTGPITDRPCLGVAAMVALDASGRCEDLRVALSSVQGVSSRPLLVDAAAAGVSGRCLDDAAIDAVADVAYRRADPPSDLRASTWYRKEMTPVFVRRALAAARARLKTPR